MKRKYTKSCAFSTCIHLVHMSYMKNVGLVHLHEGKVGMDVRLWRWVRVVLKEIRLMYVHVI